MPQDFVDKALLWQQQSLLKSPGQEDTPSLCSWPERRHQKLRDAGDTGGFFSRRAKTVPGVLPAFFPV